MKNRKPRILVVDDDPSCINILGSILQETYDMSIAVNGEQALHVIEKEPRLDMILLDINMPDMDGYTICEKLKKSSDTRKIPVIFITASNTEYDEQKGLELGAVDYITKPFHSAIVRVRLKNHLELKRQHDLLEHLSFHDGLTGICNRARFDDCIEKEWYRAMRSKSALSLIMIDIDHFKQFNDYYGHVAGDDCLKDVGKTIASSLDRTSDVAARYGGEEFACILPSTLSEGTMQLAEKIRYNVQALKIVHEKSPTNEFLTLSMGLATTVPIFRDSLSRFISKADKMLYKAKQQGRNRIIDS